LTSKVLYVGPFYDGTGYSNAAINTALAIDAAGVDVVCRNVKLTGQVIEPPDRIKALLQKSQDGCTHVIQNVLPNLMVYYGGMKNIGYFFCETTDFQQSGWQHYLNLMDEVWVCCDENVSACKFSAVKSPVKQVFIPNTFERLNKEYPVLTQFTQNNPYIFYFIGDFSSRKNITDVIKAYLLTFSKAHNVRLVLKTYYDGVSGPESAQRVKQEIESIKMNLRKFNNQDYYPPISIITDYLSDEQIMSLHETCDCYVSAEKGAAWNIPAFEAMAKGNWVICNKWGGQNQFIDKTNGDLVPSETEGVYGMGNCPYVGMYAGRELWKKPDLSMLGLCMRSAYHQDKRSLPIKPDHKFLTTGPDIKIFKDLLQ